MKPKYRTLTECMESERLTQEQVAARLGVRQGHISNILNRKRGVSLAFAFQIQHVLGVDAQSFIVSPEERERNRRGTTQRAPAHR